MAVQAESPVASYGSSLVICIRGSRHFCKRSERLFINTSERYSSKRRDEGRRRELRATTYAASGLAVMGGRPELRVPSAAELKSMKLPALWCSFPSRVHPDYEQVKEHCDGWIERVAQPSSPGASRLLRDCLLPRLVCRFIPQALQGPRLLHAVKFISWLMIADDDDDHPDLLGSDYSSTCQRADCIMAILTCTPHKRSSFNDGRLSVLCSSRLDALADLWQELCPEMSAPLRSRFISSMADYLEGIKMQAILRHEVCVPDVESYMEIRRQASFTIPAFILSEYASGIELDQATTENALVVELRNEAVDYISLCNDIFSCYKEISVGDYFNLPSILYTWNIPIETSSRTCTSFQDSLDHVAKLTQDMNVHCSSLIADIKEEYNSKLSLDPINTQHVHAYVDLVAFGMSGALAWFLETPRYQQPCTLTTPTRDPSFALT